MKNYTYEETRRFIEELESGRKYTVNHKYQLI